MPRPGPKHAGSHPHQKQQLLEQLCVSYFTRHSLRKSEENLLARIVEFKPEFYCNVCGEEKWFSDPAHLRRHVLSKKDDPAHERLVREYTELTCSCGVEFEKRELFSRHKRRCNSELFHGLRVSLTMDVKGTAASSSATPRGSIAEAVGVQGELQRNQ